MKSIAQGLFLVLAAARAQKGEPLGVEKLLASLRERRVKGDADERSTTRDTEPRFTQFKTANLQSIQDALGPLLSQYGLTINDLYIRASPLTTTTPAPSSLPLIWEPVDFSLAEVTTSTTTAPPLMFPLERAQRASIQLQKDDRAAVITGSDLGQPSAAQIAAMLNLAPKPNEILQLAAWNPFASIPNWADWLTESSTTTKPPRTIRTAPTTTTTTTTTVVPTQKSTKTPATLNIPWDLLIRLGLMQEPASTTTTTAAPTLGMVDECDALYSTWLGSAVSNLSRIRIAIEEEETSAVIRYKDIRPLSLTEDAVEELADQLEDAVASCTGLGRHQYSIFVDMYSREELSIRIVTSTANQLEDVVSILTFSN